MMFRKSILTLTLALTVLSSATLLKAQLPPTRISDEGGAKSVFFNLDCVGGGVTCSTSGINATLTVPTGYSSSDFDTDYAAELAVEHTWPAGQVFEGIGVAGTAAAPGGAGIVMTGTHSDYLGPLLSNFTYTGASTVIGALQSEVTQAGSGGSPVIWGVKVAALATDATSGIFYTTGLEASVGMADSAQVLGAGDVGVFIGANANIRSAGGTHSPFAWYIAMGFYIPAFPAVTGPGVLIERGIYSEENIDIASNVRLGLDAGLLSNATTYIVYNSSLAEVQTIIGGTEIQALKTNAIGWFGAAPATRPAAYTQTYAVASRTNNAVAFSGAVLSSSTPTSGGWGWRNNAEMVAALTEIDVIQKDLEDIKELVNQVIDDLQGYGLLQ